MNLCGWMNEITGEKIITRETQKQPLPFSFSGIQIIDSKIFKYFPNKDVFSLVELYLNSAKKEMIAGYLHDKDEWIDLGKMENLNEAEKIFERIRNTYQV